MENTAIDLAQLMIAILTIDIEYDYQPVHGHHPIRHQLAWMYAEQILGKERVEEIVESCLREVGAGQNGPVKTNPTKTFLREQEKGE